MPADNRALAWLNAAGPERTCNAVCAPTEVRLAGERSTSIERLAIDTPETRLQSFDAVPVPVFACANDGALLYCNRRLAEYVGSDSAIKDGWLSLVHPDDRDDCRRACQQLQDAGGALEIDCRLRRGDGTYLWHSLRFARSDEARATAGWLAVATDIDQRKQLETKLDDADAEAVRLRAALDHQASETLAILDVIPLAIGIAEDVDCDVIRVNAAFADVLGTQPNVNVSKSAAGAAGLSFRILKDGIEMPAQALPMQVAARTGTSLEAIELDIVRGDGTSTTVLAYAAPLFDSERNVSGSIAAFVDVTQQRRAQRKLAQSEEMYRSLAEALPAMVLLTSTDGEVQYANRRLLDYSGRSIDELKTDWGDLIHPVDRERGSAAFSESVGLGKPFVSEYRVRRRDGMYRWHLGNTVPLRGADGAVFGWLGATIDIEDRKRGEMRERFIGEASNALASSLDYRLTLARAVELAVPLVADVCAIDLFGPDGALHRLAHAEVVGSGGLRAIRMRDWRVAPDSETTVGRAVSDGTPVLLTDINDEWLRGATRSAEQYEAARSIGLRSAVIVPMRVRDRLFGVISLLSGASGRCYEIQDRQMAEDLARRASVAIENSELFSEAQRTAADLHRANDAKDEFLGLVSHELRTPITTIFGNAYVLRKNAGRLREEDQNAAIADIEAEAQRLQGIIDNMFVLARIEAGGEIATEPILVRHVIDSAVSAHRIRFPGRKIVSRVPDTLEPAMAEQVYVDQVVRNLLNNAEKYSPPESAVEIEATMEGDDIAVRVLDRGSGIDMSEAEQIFTAFYRSSRTALHASGTGIGLAVCKRLVEAQAGRIWARSREGGGAEFGFTLPIDKEMVI